MLQIIYRQPLHLLFKGLFEELQNEVRRKTEGSPALKHITEDLAETEQGDGQNFCTYSDLANTPAASQAELVHVYRHVTKLAKKLAHLR